jgi:hypothetical protein
MKLQKHDAFYEDWIWLEAKKKPTSVFSLPNMVFPALMICTGDCLGCGIITGDDKEDQYELETVTSLAKAETTYSCVHTALVGINRTF